LADPPPTGGVGERGAGEKPLLKPGAVLAVKPAADGMFEGAPKLALLLDGWTVLAVGADPNAKDGCAAGCGALGGAVDPKVLMAVAAAGAPKLGGGVVEPNAKDGCATGCGTLGGAVDPKLLVATAAAGAPKLGGVGDVEPKLTAAAGAPKLGGGGDVEPKLTAAAGAPKLGGGGVVVPAACASPGWGVLAGADPNVKDGCGAAVLLAVALTAVAVVAGTGPGCGVLAAVEPNAKAGSNAGVGTDTGTGAAGCGALAPN
jgi:hypothetical protein